VSHIWQVRTSFIERFYYGKVYGFLFVHAGGTLLVFDTDLQVSNKGGKTDTIARAGAVYVRRGSASAPARQIELEAAVSNLLGRGVRAFLARVEQVATLPATTQLIAHQPGAGSGYVLTAAGQSFFRIIWHPHGRMRTRSNPPTCDDASLDCSEPVQLFGFSAI